MLNNASTLIAAAKREPSALAIIDKGKAIDYESLLSLSTTLGSNLLSLGLTKGSHLVTLLQNNWQSTLIYWACQLYGIIIKFILLSRFQCMLTAVVQLVRLF